MGGVKAMSHLRKVILFSAAGLGVLALALLKRYPAVPHIRQGTGTIVDADRLSEAERDLLIQELASQT